MFRKLCALMAMASLLPVMGVAAFVEYSGNYHDEGVVYEGNIAHGGYEVGPHEHYEGPHGHYSRSQEHYDDGVYYDDNGYYSEPPEVVRPAYRHYVRDCPKVCRPSCCHRRYRCRPRFCGRAPICAPRCRPCCPERSCSSPRYYPWEIRE